MKEKCWQVQAAHVIPATQTVTNSGVLTAFPPQLLAPPLALSFAQTLISCVIDKVQQSPLSWASLSMASGYQQSSTLQNINICLHSFKKEGGKTRERENINITIVIVLYYYYLLLLISCVQYRKNI
jgi:hypothetical protein